jgi:PAS domain S-box-containing protein
MLASDGELLGIISVDEPLSGGAPSDEELDVLVAVAAHAARAIEAAREAAETARHQSALEQLLRVSSHLAGPHGMDEVLQSVCEGIWTALGFRLVVIELADREADRFVPRAAAGLLVPHAAIQLEAPIERVRRLFDQAYEREGCYLLERDQALALVGAEPAGFSSSLNGRGPEAWNHHWLVVPLHDPNGEASGFIWVDEPKDRLIPSRARLQALRTFANHAETAIEAAERFDALERANEDRRALIDASPVGFVVVNRDRLVRAWNPAAQRMFGYSEEEVVGREPAWIGEAEREGFRQRFDELLAGRGERETVYTDRRADGTIIDVHTSSVLLRGPDGEVTGVLAALADITEQCRAEREREAAELARRSAEERQRALISSSPVAIVALDTHGRVESWNPAAERIFGWTAAAAVGERAPWAPPEKAAEFEGLLERVLGGESLVGLELEGGRADGTPLVMSVSAARILGEDGSGIGLITTIADVTERRQRDEALHRSRELYRAIVENSTDLISLLDLEGNVLFVSPSSERVLGLRPEQIVGGPFEIHVHPEDVEAAGAVMAEAFAGRTPAPFLARVRHADGRWLHVEGVPAPVFDEEGRTTMVLALARDVSDRIRGEEERAQLEEQLRQAQKLEAVGRLAGGIAHDFNNLLTAIGGYGDLALSRLPEDAPARASVEEMRRAGERAATLTRQLLAFSRRQVLQPEVIDLNAVVTEVRGLLERVLGEDVRLESRLAADLGSTRADPGQIEQVIVNLAVNARDAMPRGGSLTIATENVELDEAFAARHMGAELGSYVALAVSDTGRGMDRETLERAFEPFFTTKPVGQGTGLGLATVYGIVQQTGGHIRAESETGRGSTFTVFLPRVWEDAPARDEATRPARPEGSETILLVEDEEIVRSLVREMLELVGYRVLDAPDGPAALALAAEIDEPIDALVSDVVMPGLSGQELAARLTAVRPGLRVLFTSGYNEEAITNHGVLSPGSAFLEKPFTAGQLAQKLRAVLDCCDGRARSSVSGEPTVP